MRNQFPIGGVEPVIS